MGYSPEIDGQVNPYEFDGDSLFHLFGDDYIYIHDVFHHIWININSKEWAMWE